MSENEIKEYLKNNPRMIGVLFTIFVLLTQAGNSAAAMATTVKGP